MAIELPLNWVPRWNTGYTDNSSKLKQLYATGLLYHIQESQRFAALEHTINFWGEIWQPRAAFVAKYNFPENHIPQILIPSSSYTTNVENTEVRCCQTIGDFLYEYERAAYYFDGSRLLLRNLNLVTYNVTAVSGRIDLSSIFSIDPIVPDSPIVVRDSLLNTTFVDQEDRRFANNAIAIEDGDYTVRYQSTPLYNVFASGGVYITIDGENTFISPISIDNIWDGYAGFFGVKRENSETNLSLKTKCQQLSLVTKPELTIEASLGQAQVVLWDTETPLSLSASSIISAEVVGLPETLYIEEYPEKDADTYVLLYQPNSLIQLFHNTIPVPSTEYTLSGSVITPLNNKLIEAPIGSIKAKYKTNPFTISDNGEIITTITAGATPKQMTAIVVGKKVRILTTTKRETEYRWGKPHGMLEGNSDFG